jgi:hypothetical protein
VEYHFIPRGKDEHDLQDSVFFHSCLSCKLVLFGNFGLPLFGPLSITSAAFFHLKTRFNVPVKPPALTVPVLQVCREGFWRSFGIENNNVCYFQNHINTKISCQYAINPYRPQIARTDIPKKKIPGL